ncbi:MAG: alpha/beta fold hydrolase [Saprospirales bacterium]|nr:alpha/beta fold hydrolase [Saprospirales bacterium]MBK8923152.1 alpha/beta fold hydrolase [Saprospirales bacterium]
MKYFSGPRILGFFLNRLAVVAPRQAGKLSFYLLGLPRRKKTKRSEKKFLAGARLHFEDIHGRKIAVYRWGDCGPAVMLAHGWESQSGRWRKIAPALVRAGFQVIAVDAPAHGRSGGRHFTMLRYAEVLRTLLQRYGPIDAMIGHSVGGAASIWAAGGVDPALHPKRAVILAAFSSMEYVMDNARRLIGASDTLMNALDDYVEQATGARIPHYSLVRIVEKLGDVQALLVHDRHDRVTAFHQSEQLAAAWPGVRLLATDGYGHGLTAPAVLDSVLAFVQEKPVC